MHPPQLNEKHEARKQLSFSKVEGNVVRDKSLLRTTPQKETKESTFLKFSHLFRAFVHGDYFDKNFCQTFRKTKLLCHLNVLAVKRHLKGGAIGKLWTLATITELFPVLKQKSTETVSFKTCVLLDG